MTIGFGSSLIASRGSKYNWGHCLWVIELQQKEWLIGFCGIAPFEPPGFLEIGWWLDESCWGQGYATEAARVVLDYAINVLGITQLRSVSHRDHSRSQAIMRRTVSYTHLTLPTKA